MKKCYALKGRKDFQKVFRRGRRFKGNGVALIVLPQYERVIQDKSTQKQEHNKKPGTLKIGIVVRKKYGNAVMRNRAKRILRAVCREFLPELQEGYYIILQPENAFSTLNYSEIRSTAGKLFRKAGLIT